ncbi:outer membrane beta-barrel protein [Flavobacterium sp. CS20]|uniref:outer membrane beta-barrel protein n=1 Tax=Flavobacterium sp. CS20 TaxID=2775246 RepID=UPI001B3A164A|nr:outer membrane beta-barrel protein [Flavobacterium sp. CS20]QTY28025.1 outer membrane beta-barrel protein [Flavobacterium sp. CS20]
MKYFFSIVLVFSFLFSYSQNSFKISGIVKDSISQEVLISSTVYLERLKDSTMVSYSITDQNGYFEIEDFTKDTLLNLNVSYTGMKTYQQTINIKNSPIDIGTVFLNSTTDELDEVTVTANRSPIVFKKDTLEFNASSFKTRDGANLEALLKKLPGLKVDAGGNITVNGKPVQRILVNGKSFFGDDPKIATKNLPKSIIEKIQVVDTKTKQQEFTGEDGDAENKTINITIDEDKNKGIFSRLTLGGGTDGRYAMSGFGNYFKDKTRISVIAGSNNINSPGFSFDEVFDMMGNVRRVTSNSNGSFGINGINFGGNSGITKSDNVGVSYADEWPNNQELESSYFFGSNKTRNETSTRRENILPDRTFFTNSENASTNRSDSHRGTINYSIKPDTLTRISIRPNINISSGDNETSSFSESLNSDGEQINELNTENTSEFDNKTFSNNLSVSRKLKTKGAYASLRFRNTNTNSENNSFFNSIREIFGDNPNTEIQNQNIQNNSHRDEYSITGSYRNLLFDDLFYSLTYEYVSESEKSERNVFDFDENTGEFSSLNEDLSNAFTVRANKHIPKAGVRFDDDTLTVSVSGGLNRTELKTNNLIQDVNFNNDFNVFAYSGYIAYRFKNKSRLSSWFNNSTRIPSVSQLQPVTIQTNPLNITLGNPNLDASVVHNFSLSYRKYDFKTRSGYGFYSYYSYNEDQVVSVTTTDDNLVRTTTYTNLSGGQNANLNFYIDKSLKKSKNQNDRENITAGGNFSFIYNKNLGFSNAQNFRSESYRFSPSIDFRYEIEDLINIEPEFGITHNITTYNLQQSLDEEFTNLNFGMELTTYYYKNVTFGNDITFTKLGNISSDFDSDFLLWNVSLGYTFADEKAIVKFKVYDLLDQNINTQRTTGDDFIQDTNQLILEQYFMFSFTYKFSKFGGKDPSKSRRFN